MASGEPDRGHERVQGHRVDPRATTVTSGKPFEWSYVGSAEKWSEVRESRKRGVESDA